MLDFKVKLVDEFSNFSRDRANERAWLEEHGDAMVIFNYQSRLIEYAVNWTPLSLKFVLSGKKYYHFRDKSVAVTDQNFLILNEGAAYESSINTTSPTESLVFNFTRQNIRDVYKGMFGTPEEQMDNPFEKMRVEFPFIEMLYDNYAALDNLVFKARRLCRLHAVQELTIEFFYTLLENMIALQEATYQEIDRMPMKKRSTRIELYKRLHIVKDVIDSCYHQKLSLGELASVSFLNSYYLSREFKKIFGDSPHQYLLKRRLMEAEKLLREDELSINEIISQVGFQDPSSFSRSFKRFSSLSPDHFRKSCLISRAGRAAS